LSVPSKCFYCFGYRDVCWLAISVSRMARCVNYGIQNPSYARE
jgi:hypothetical protein